MRKALAVAALCVTLQIRGDINGVNQRFVIVNDANGNTTVSVVPEDLVAAPSGALWFIDRKNSAVGKLTQQAKPGSVYFTAVEFPLQNVNTFSAPTVGSDGNIWFGFAGSGTNRGIARVTDNGTITLLPVAQSGVLFTLGIVTGGDGNFYSANSGGNGVVRVTPQGSTTQFNSPSGKTIVGALTRTSDGNFLFRESGAVGKFNINGTFTEIPLPAGQSATSAVIEGPDGNYWYGDSSTNSIGRMTPSGKATEFKIPQPQMFPTGLVFTSDGNLLFSSGFDPIIGRLQADSISGTNATIDIQRLTLFSGGVNQLVLLPPIPGSGALRAQTNEGGAGDTVLCDGSNQSRGQSLTAVDVAAPRTDLRVSLTRTFTNNINVAFAISVENDAVYKGPITVVFKVPNGISDIVESDLPRNARYDRANRQVVIKEDASFFLGPFDPVEYRFQAVLDPLVRGEVVATVELTATNDVNLENNTASNRFNTLEPELEIQKIHHEEDSDSGQITWVIAVSNRSTVPYQGTLKITDVLPLNLAVSDASPSPQCSAAGNVFMCQLDGFPAAQFRLYSFRTPIPPRVESGPTEPTPVVYNNVTLDGANVHVQAVDVLKRRTMLPLSREFIESVKGRH